MTNETLESMKGPIVVVSLILVFGLAIAFGQGMSDADSHRARRDGSKKFFIFAIV
jgi:hypothetical protein